MDTETNKTTSTEKVSTNEKKKSSTGLDENIGGLVAYVLTFLSGLILVFIEKENKFIRFHALQSTITFGGLFIISMVLGIIPIIGILTTLLIMPLWLVLWVFLMYKAYNGVLYKLPIVGEFAEEQVSKLFENEKME
ncbi:DUF4870 domain-containing protein [Evansella sp. AB-rgal1]|uniref:DUF4870 domain-containing protein n=1 Tax=Evansella sp. AB-rgal1 TaxID=3242696 RepID=UPI00359EF8AA